MNDYATWHQLVNDGALAAFAIFVIWALWRIGSIGGRRMLELGDRYVSTTESLHDALKDADRQQKELCQSHQTTLTVLAESVDENTIIQREQCCHLKELVDLYTSPGAAVVHSMHQTDSLHGDMKRMKRAAVRACEMCRTIANNEFPNSAAKIDEHCTEIEKLIRDSGPIDVEGLGN